MSILSDNLKKARAYKGWTQQQVADKICLNLKAYQSYEEGRCHPQLITFVNLVRVLEITDPIGFITLADYPLEENTQKTTVIAEKMLDLVQEKYNNAPIKDKLAVNILLGLVDLD